MTEYQDMVKLTDRLMLMAEQIKENETMADIGTDHG
ncbi:MAG: SAM-dependent methyltransferase, partial [Firmicutes bacterium]|nr:SAM-dependent methyltransferase [Bacillota bacterium]